MIHALDEQDPRVLADVRIQSLHWQAYRWALNVGRLAPQGVIEWDQAGVANGQQQPWTHRQRLAACKQYGWPIVYSLAYIPNGYPDATYQQTIRNLVHGTEAAGVRVLALAPYNEPNHSAFCSPQRFPNGRPRSPGVYTHYWQLAKQALKGTGITMLAGELAGMHSATSRASKMISIQEFIDNLPTGIANQRDWSLHDYTPGGGTKALLDHLARKSHAHHRIWITEAGALTARMSETDAAESLGSQLGQWKRDAHLATQYTAQNIPTFPCGIISGGSELASYRAWI